MIYEEVCFKNNQEIAFDEKNVQYNFEIGQSLAEYLPCEVASDLREHKQGCYNGGLRNLLFEFYSECEKNINLYNEDNLLFRLSKNGYILPKWRYNFGETPKDKCIGYRLNTKGDEEKNEIDYMIAVAFELVKRKITLNKCEECGKWFVAYNKTDKTYCPDCAKKRTRQINTNHVWLVAIKKKFKNIRQSYPKEDKEYQDTFTHENEIAQRKPNNKTATLKELKAFNTWLKAKRKEWYPQKRTKGRKRMEPETAKKVNKVLDVIN